MRDLMNKVDQDHAHGLKDKEKLMYAGITELMNITLKTWGEYVPYIP